MKHNLQIIDAKVHLLSSSDEDLSITKNAKGKNEGSTVVPSTELGTKYISLLNYQVYLITGIRIIKLEMLHARTYILVIGFRIY